METKTNITERIKTFEDALDSLSTEHPMKRNWIALSSIQELFAPNMVAYAKLCVIAAALNEEWELRWGSSQIYYYPWFYIYSGYEFSQLPESRQKELVLLGGGALYGAYCGLGYVSSYHSFSYSSASVGSRLAFRSAEIAKYCGQQFVTIWAEYLS